MSSHDASPCLGLAPHDDLDSAQCFYAALLDIQSSRPRPGARGRAVLTLDAAADAFAHGAEGRREREPATRPGPGA